MTNSRVSSTAPATLKTTVASGEAMVVDLSTVPIAGPSGVVWGMSGSELNANLVSLQAGDSIDEHVNDEVDVLVVVEAGTGQVMIDGVEHRLSANSIALVPRGAARSMHAEEGLLYFSIHVRREGLVLRR